MNSQSEYENSYSFIWSIWKVICSTPARLDWEETCRATVCSNQEILSQKLLLTIFYLVHDDASNFKTSCGWIFFSQFEIEKITTNQNKSIKNENWKFGNKINFIYIFRIFINRLRWMNERNTKHTMKKSERDRDRGKESIIKIDEKVDNRLALGWKNAGYLSV